MADTAPGAAPAAPPAPAPPTGRARRRLAVAAVALVAVGLLLLAPLPAYVQTAGPAFGLAERVTLPDADPIRGDYLFTTVRLVDATVVEALAAAVDPAAVVVSRRSVTGGQPEGAFLAHQQAAFDQAGSLAARLGLEAVGSDLDPARVVIADDGVGGPSAGLLTALAVADLASPADLARGRRISGTGALEEDGDVGPVGGVADKVAAAQAAGAAVFLVPAEQVGQARATGTSMEVVGVATVVDAVEALAGG